MPKELPANVEAVVAAFKTVFGSNCQTWGTPTRGGSDGVNGVQWNCGVTEDRNEAFLGVNLEGIEYRGFPVSSLIQEELQQPTLLDLVSAHPRLQRAILSWRRDAWQASARPPIKERYISPTPIELGRLTPDGWKTALTEALACLDKDKLYRKRAQEIVTVSSTGQRKQFAVSPHLHVRLPLWFGSPPSVGDRIERMRQAREVLQPLYEWAKKRSA